jgi:hypothetical protein
MSGPTRGSLTDIKSTFFAYTILNIEEIVHKIAKMFCLDGLKLSSSNAFCAPAIESLYFLWIKLHCSHLLLSLLFSTLK